jgi:hypothetical protein
MHDPGVLIDPPRNRLVRIYVWRACLDSTCKLQDTRLELHRGKGPQPVQVGKLPSETWKGSRSKGSPRMR